MYSSDDEKTMKLIKKVEPGASRKCKTKTKPSPELDIDGKKVYDRARMCQICGTMQKGLKAHMATHSTERAFKCT